MKSTRCWVAVVLATMAIMAWGGVGTASAGGVLCSVASTPCSSKWPTPTTIDWSLAGTIRALIRDTSGNTLDACTSSTLTGSLVANPNASGSAEVKITALTWGGCTVTTDTLWPGTLEVTAGGLGVGQVFTSSKIEFTINVFSSCNYGVAPGTYIGQTSEGANTATFKISAVAKKWTGGFLCPETATWTVDEYTLSTPIATTHYVSSS
jgi:hypothetical protein